MLQLGTGYASLTYSALTYPRWLFGPRTCSHWFALPIFAFAFLAGSSTIRWVPAWRMAINAPPFEGIFRKRSPLVPTALETITVNSSLLSSLGGSAGALGTDGTLGVDDVLGTSGGSLTGRGTGSVTGTGVVGVTASRYHAAANPCCP